MPLKFGTSRMWFNFSRHFILLEYFDSIHHHSLNDGYSNSLFEIKISNSVLSPTSSHSAGETAANRRGHKS